LPDSPGRAARKPAGNEASVSGTELLLLPDDSWREWLRETSFQGLLLFWGPAKQDFSKFGVSKKQLIAAEFAYKRIVVDLD
jgi:hypothetical protein